MKNILFLLSFLSLILLVLNSFTFFSEEESEFKKLSPTVGGFTYVYSKPLKAHYEEWKSSEILDSLIALNLISVSEKVELAGNKKVYPIMDILGWDYFEGFPILDERTAWTYSAYDASNLEVSKEYEIKITPHYHLNGSGYLRYYRTHEESKIWLPRISYDVSSRIFHDDLIRNLLYKFYALLNNNEGKMKEDKGFWSKVSNGNYPIVFTEGMKKSLSILSAGEIGVSIPGACSGFQLSKTGNKLELTKGLKAIITNNRKVYLHFDNDPQNYIKNVVHSAMLITAELIQKNGNEVRIVQHSDGPKGADDYIVKFGAENYKKLLDKSITIEEFKNSGFKFLSENDLINTSWCIVPCQSKCLYDKDLEMRK